MDMRSVAPMKTAKIGYIVMSVLFCVLGVVLLFTPGVSALWIGRLLGIGLILFGAIKLVGYFSRDLFRLAFQYDLAFGLLLMVLGIVTLSHPGDALSFLCVMFGIPVLADGLFKIQIAMDSRQFGIRNWWLVLVLATRYVSLGSIVAAIVTPFLAWYMEYPLAYVIFSAIAAFFVVLRHKENIQRLLSGTESKIKPGNAKDLQK